MTDREAKQNVPQRKANPSKDQPRDAERAENDRSGRSDRDRDGTMTDDERIDEAERESFPASDPPSQP
jgi:hypothetical protein